MNKRKLPKVLQSVREALQHICFMILMYPDVSFVTEDLLLPKAPQELYALALIPPQGVKP